ncbi:MAG: hypothetical protein LLF83_01455 [Methanobacterium sp.]|nr:hypothetical protein [Methanobacterium sp.]
MHREMGGMHMHDRHGHMHHRMEKDWMMNKEYMEKFMGYLSDEDKKKLTAAKIAMKIAMYEKKKELLEEKKKIMAMKYDMKAEKMEKKIEMLKMMRDMIEDKD